MKAQVASCLVELTTSQGEVSASFRFPPQLEVFAGHFPGRPLVPGVMLIEAARLACARGRGGELSIRRVARAKFSGEVRPGELVELRGSLSPELILLADLRVAERVVAKLKLELGEAA